jgi:hypothetical protein
LKNLSILSAGIVAWLCASAAPAGEFWVSPTGKDTDPGTRERPFASLARARDAIRAQQPLSEHAVVRVAPGAYSLTNTLEFTAGDSAPDGKRIVFRAADSANKPRFSAGRILHGAWREEADGIFSIDAGAGNFRQLFVNGRLATTAREPNAGAWRQLKQWEPMTKTLRLQGSGIMAKWQRMDQVEFVIKKHWAMSRLHVKWWGTYDGDDVFAPHRPDLEFEKANVPPKEPNQLYFFENALEFLDQPGEWYLDRSSRRLYYKPHPGEDLAKTEIIAPQLERMVNLNGAANITFDGLVFEHANWTYPDGEGGYVGAQANVHWDGWRVNPGAIHLTHTRDITFTNCVVRDCTAAGIVLTKGTQRTHFEGNVFTGIGETPITVYAESNKNPVSEDQCRDDVIRNNLISGFGTHNYAAAGICVSVATRITVEHNEVRDGDYSGITYGYFSRHDSPAAGSRIQYNHIHHVMRELDDGAGIYIFTTKFDLSGSTLLVYRNFIHDVYRGETAEPNPCAGIYLDEGASGVTLRENVIRSVGNTIHLNTGNEGRSNETKPQEQVYDGNTDEHAAWEKAAGLQPAWARLDPSPSKPAPLFERVTLLHHWTLDGILRDEVTGKAGEMIGGAAFSESNRVEGAAALVLSGKAQWAQLPEIEWPDRFTLAFRVWMPTNAFGERALISTPGFRLYSAVDIGQFKEELRTETWDAKGHSTARTLNGALPRGQWNHVVITVDRRHDAQRVYVNGKDVTRTDHLGHREFASRGPVLLGAYTTDNPKDRWRDLHGAIDDVRIYAGHLRENEIRALERGVKP